MMLWILWKVTWLLFHASEPSDAGAVVTSRPGLVGPSVRGWILAAAAAVPAVIVASTVGPLATIGFDPFHDGFHLAAAVATASGATPHVDFFSQYGPLLPFLHASVVAVGASPGLALRIVDVAALVAIAALLPLVGSTSGRWPISRRSAILGATVWAVGADHATSGIPAIPSPGTMGLLLVVLVIVALRAAVESSGSGPRTMIMSTSVIPAILVLLLLVRIHVLVIVVVGLIFTAVVAFAVHNRSVARIAGSAVGGFIILLLILAMSTPGEMRRAYIDQVIVFNFQLFLVDDYISPPIAVRILLWLLATLPAAAIVAAALLVTRRRADRMGGSRALAVSFLLLLGLVGGVMSGVFSTQGILQLALRRSPSEWVGAVGLTIVLSSLLAQALPLITAATDANLRIKRFVEFAAGSVAVVNLWMVGLQASLFVLTSGLIATQLWLQLVRPRRIEPEVILITVVAAAPLVEVVSASARHAWIGVSIACVVGVQLILEKWRSPILLAGAIAAAGIVTVSVFPPYQADIRRNSAPVDVPVLDGLRGVREGYGDASEIRHQSEVLGEVLSDENQALFLTRNGHLSALVGRYASSDPWFVDWAPRPEGRPDLRSASIVVADPPRADELLENGNWTIVGMTDLMVVLRRR